MSERKWTDDQRRAIYADSGSILVAAAAGSGKTSVLTQRIVNKLTCAEGSVTPDSLLVVTFTNAAASEMRNRIFKEISRKMNAEPERRGEFQHLAARLDEMTVCTMDSFCISLVRENFNAAGVEADFRMLEKGESDLLKNEALLETVERLYREDAVNFEPLSRIFEKGTSDTGLIGSILKLSDFSMSEPDPDEWLGGVADNFKNTDPKDSVFGKIISDRIEEGLDYCRLLCSAALEDISQDEELAAKIGKTFDRDIEILNKLCADFSAADWDSRIGLLNAAVNDFSLNKLSTPRGYGDNPQKTAAKLKRDTVKSVLKELAELLCVNRQENADDICVLAPVAQELIKAVRLCNELMLSKKKALNAYDFSDILHFALLLLSDASAADGKSFRAREISERLSEILIDEYQDTNRAQERLFTLISKNAENIFMVGDVKQCIYRFRLASPEMFIEKCENFPYYDGKSKKSKIILSENFRSRKGVTQAVNFIFSALMSKRCGEIEYNADERLNSSASYPEAEGADVEFSVLDGSDAGSLETEAAAAARKISEMLESGAKVYENGCYRAARPSDFCILLRAAKGVAPVFEIELKKAGLKAARAGSSDFFESAQIKIMLSFLSVLDNPTHDVELLSVMMSPLFGFSADAAANVRIRARASLKPHSGLFAAVVYCSENGDEKCRELVKSISYYRKLSAVLSAGELIREIYADTSFISVAGAMPAGGVRKNNLRLLLEYAEKNSGENQRTLSDFVRYMRALQESGKSLEGASGAADEDSVSIMTVHGSKGLEFPFVILSGLNKNFNRLESKAALLVSHRNGIGIKRREPENIKQYSTLSSVAIGIELENAMASEELRIYYVALTRAKEKLIIIAAPENADKLLLDTSMLLPQTEKIPPYYIKKANIPLKWFAAVFLHHRDGAALRRYGHFTVESPSRAGIHYIENFTPLPEKAPPAAEPAKKELVAEIRQRAGFSYRYKAVAGAASKHTASTADAECFNPARFAKSVPAFMELRSASPADIGTATHRFMQFCDFAACRENCSAEKERLVKTGRLTPVQAGLVDTEAAAVFAASAVMERAERSGRIFREKQFTVSKSVCELDPSVPKCFSDEKTIVIGKIDMYFIENGEAVIVDYKTDNISDINLLAGRYAVQMELYREALYRCTGVPVKECILYSLKLRQSISI